MRTGLSGDLTRLSSSSLKNPTELEMTLLVFSVLVGVPGIGGPSLSNLILFLGGWKHGEIGLNRWKKLKMEDCFCSLVGDSQL